MEYTDILLGDFWKTSIRNLSYVFGREENPHILNFTLERRVASSSLEREREYLVWGETPFSSTALYERMYVYPFHVRGKHPHEN